jgi:hypothetical protein
MVLEEIQMNHWHLEAMAEFHRKGIEREMNHIRLEELARNAHLHPSGWFSRSMFGFANWMIVTGKQLRRRYEVPAPDCRAVSTKSFAR